MECRTTLLSRHAGTAATMFAFAISTLAGTAAAQTSRTPWGHPDLQGTYTNATQTPFERPEALSDKAFLTEEEAAQLEQRQAERFAAALEAPAVQTEAGGQVGAYNEFWYDARARVVGTRRTSLVVDPPNGRVPVRAEALAARDYHLERISDDYLHLGPWDRCIARGTPSNFFQSAYNNNYMILQTPDTVAIYFEMIHDVRVIPLDGRPHIGDGMQLWNGDSRGHWEGDTLVVETTNLTEKGWISTSVIQGRIRGVTQTKDTRLVERFTRVDEGTIDYQVTVIDPVKYTAPWTAQIPLYIEDGLVLYEYACHEGNWAVHNILSGGRAEDQAAATGGR